MSLNAIMNTANSGMAAAQTQLRIVSDNVSNVNTPGYVRKIGDQVSLSSAGMGSGVDVARIRLATDKFLQAASLSAGADASRQGVRYELYDRVQSLFGDPGGDSGFFSQVDGLFAAFSAVSESAASSPLRQEALVKTQSLFDEAARISKQVHSVRQDADGRLQSAVEKANTLLEQIENLNKEITRAQALSGDSSGAETAQAALIGQLGELMDIRVAGRATGGVTIRTGGGALLAGQGAAKLEYTRAGTVTGETVFNEIWVTEPGAQKRPLLETITSGEIKGLVELRDVDAPAAAERLAELMSGVADELNRAHNANSSVPAPNSLTGRNVGQTFEDAIAGFGGRSTVAVTNATGVITARADIVFSGSTMTVNGVAATPANFLTILNGQLGGAATASFTDGRLTIRATNANDGVAIADDAAAPSNKAGRGFSHFFGMNDLVSTDRPAIYQTGLTPASTHGFTAGQTISFRFNDAGGSRIRDIQVAMPAGGTVNDLLTALNDPATGVGRFGSFSLSADGSLNFNGTGNPAPTMSVVRDDTSQTPSGVSLSELFGIGGVRSSRADGFTVRQDIRQAPMKLALAKLNLSAPAGTPALSTGDGRGALLLADAGERATIFSAAGGSAGGTMTVSRYASDLAGDIGGRAAAVENQADASAALYQEANARKVSHEGVNLDEELVLMTTYQQAFNASARLIQAAKDMYDILLGMTR
ncbi:flagellar hook-associated protein FlgK [Brevundimonas sp. NPDC092305]|uniref:flagellar hook-associated protein FlgK n=1 Tax=Brevundimonas sp. NPDC092305 TaxID=3363957 RepID=UPI00382E45D0